MLGIALKCPQETPYYVFKNTENSEEFVLGHVYLLWALKLVLILSKLKFSIILLTKETVT